MESLLNIPSFYLWLLLLLVLVLRYVLVAGIPYLWLYVFGKNKYKTLKLQNEIPERKQIFSEIKYSFFTLCIYSSGIWLFLYWLKHGYTRNYAEIGEFGWPYFVLSVFLMIIIHDLYSYWIHRLIHHKLLFVFLHFFYFSVGIDDLNCLIH